MSVDCELFIGYTVNLKNDLKREDFDFFDKCQIEHKIKDQFDDLKNGEVYLVVDGMNGQYARLINLTAHKDNLWSADGKADYEILNDGIIPKEVYEKLNDVYKKMYNEDLNIDRIEFASWLHWS